MEKLIAALLLAATTAIAQPVPDSAVVTSGRIAQADAGWLATWPGVHWALRFEGSALGVRLDDALNHWVLEIDGAPALQIAPAPGERTVWLRGLPPGAHEARLIKRSESSGQAARVLGFVLDGGRLLPPPARPARLIEFIGDSYTAGYGNLSAGRDCAATGIAAQTDASQGYAVLTARALGADWRLHARSGAGLLRNWAGSRPGETLLTDYARLLQDRPGAPPAERAAERPDVVVLAVGINDFSTPPAPGEPRDAARLEADFLAAYRALIARQPPGARLVMLSAKLGNGDRLRGVIDRLAADHPHIARLDWGDLDASGCDAHPSATDHRRMATRLTALIRSLDTAK